MILSSENKLRLAEEFRGNGFIGPLKLLTSAQCRLITRYDQYGKHPKPADWSKGRAVTERFFYNLATRPTITELIKLLLGENFILWGASIVSREPSDIHPWHTDIETSAPGARAATVWVGLQNLARDATPQLISRSHRLGFPLQRAARDHGLKRGEVSAEDALAWARKGDPRAELCVPAMQIGDVLIFDGRIWHEVANSHSEGTRKALLLQYAASRTPIRMPDFSQLEWPFRFKKDPRPPAIRVSGKGGRRTNRLCDPPPPEPNADQALTTAIRSLGLPLAENQEKGWQPYHRFKGRTRNTDFMGCHISVLSPGHSPHPPHVHLHEELLLVLAGEAEIVIPDDVAAENARIETLRPGAFVYYPAFQAHTIRNASAKPVSYLMFRWHGPPGEVVAPMNWDIVRYDGISAPENPKPFFGHLLFENPTSYMSKLHAHYTILQPGGGYKVHADRHDVAIVTLSGFVETLGETVTPHSVIFYSGGEPHGMKNVGDDVAQYLVFEFHGFEYREPMDASPAEHSGLVGRIIRPFAERFLPRTRGS